jgi:hypothetical protein
VDLARSDENGDYGVRQLSKGTVAQLLSGARDGEKGMGSSSPRGRGRRRGVEGPSGAPHGDAKGGGSGGWQFTRQMETGGVGQAAARD